MMLTLRVRIANALRWLEYRMVPPPAPVRKREGKWCLFILMSPEFGEACWAVHSQRGGMQMGRIRFSPQWRAYQFVPDKDAVYNGGFIAEVYAFLKERGQQTGRFV